MLTFYTFLLVPSLLSITAKITPVPNRIHSLSLFPSNSWLFFCPISTIIILNFNFSFNPPSNFFISFYSTEPLHFFLIKPHLSRLTAAAGTILCQDFSFFSFLSFLLLLKLHHPRFYCAIPMTALTSSRSPF